MFGFLDKPIFDSRFDIAQADRAGAGPAGAKLGLFDGRMAARGNDDVKMDVRQSAPIELHGGSRRIHFHARAVRRGKRIEFVVLVIDGFRIVGLKGRAGPSRWRTKEQGKEKQRQ